MTGIVHPNTTGVLFVCLGNICRSPLAEGIFRDLVHRRGAADRFDIDSCGTGDWHVGEPPDPRTVAVARRHGIPLRRAARQLDPAADFARFHYLLAMDRSNLRSLQRSGAPADRLYLLRAFDPGLRAAPLHELDVPDPYHALDDHRFEEVVRMLRSACLGLLDHLLADR